MIAIGNRSAGDDAVGLMLVENMEKRLDRADLFFQLWESADALTMAHDLLSLENAVLFVDCADMGIEPGEVCCFDAGSARLKIHSDGLSTHGLGMADALALAVALGFDQRVSVFGVQPFHLSPSLSLSPPMQTRLPCLLDALEKTIIEILEEAPGV